MQESIANIGSVLQVLRVKSMFLAQERHRKPVHMEPFEAGELLLAISSEDGDTVFCRHDESAGLDDRRRFVLSDEDFERLTTPA